MAKKLDRPFTLAEKVHHYAVNRGWVATMNSVRRPGEVFNQEAFRRLTERIEPKMARLRDRLTASRRFILSDELVTSMGHPPIEEEMKKPFDIGDSLTALTEGARLPFPFMWLESERGNIGYLLCRISADDPKSWIVSSFANTQVENDPIRILGASLIINPDEAHRRRIVAGGREWSAEERMRSAEREFIVQLWGFQPNEISDAEFAHLEQHATAQVDSYLVGAILSQYPETRHEALKAFAAGSAALRGSIPFFLELMNILNSPLVTLDTRVVKGFYQHRLKNMPYLTANTITLNVAPHKVRKFLNDKVAEHLRTKHRAHEVRGFWRHYLSKAACDPKDHDWFPSEHDRDLHHCSHCAGRRRWIKEHMRGDASLGYVNHNYRLVSEPEKQHAEHMG